MAYQGVRDQASATFAVTNYTEGLSLDCNVDLSGSLTVQDVLGTVINELIEKGILNGTVAA